MAKDIEEFLKMAAERRKAAQAQQNQKSAGGATPPPAATTPPPVQTPRTSGGGPRAGANRPQTGGRGAAGKPVVGGKQVEVVQRRESVAEHVQSHVQTKRLAEHAAKLGKEIGQADDKLEAHLHQKFDHDVGRLGAKADEARGQRRASSTPLPSPAAAIRALLQNQQNVQQAIILGEVLRRPEW